MGKCIFDPAWLKVEEWSSWLRKDNGNKHNFYCFVCSKTFDLGKMGKHAVIRHGESAAHKKNSSGQRPRTLDELMSQGATNSTDTVVKSSSTYIPSAVLKAEIMWALKVTTSHLSFRSNIGNSELFKEMFPDSDIAKNYAMSETKCRYMISYGLAPHFHDMLLKTVGASNYVALFDESHNGKTATKQLDTHIRLWNDGKVESRYLTSEFMGHASANDLNEAFRKTTNQLSLKNVLQLSMDGPNVNWKFFDNISAEIEMEHQVRLLNIGSCGLHVVHGAFRTGAEKCEFEIESLLTSLFYLFKDSPARRSDFLSIGATQFPMKYCRTRWLDNYPAIQRAEEIWSDIAAYCKATKIAKPKNNSYKIVKEFTTDPFVLAKLAFFKTVMKVIQPFLQHYQTDKPMVPFLVTDIARLSEDLMRRFVKPSIVDAATKRVRDLLNVNVSDTDTHMEPGKINIGFKAESILKDIVSKKTASEKAVLGFRLGAKEMLIAIVKKIMERSPLRYALTRCLACLDPREMASDRVLCGKRFSDLCKILVENKRLLADDVDDVVAEYDRFLRNEVTAKPNLFKDFEPYSDRVDELFYSEMRPRCKRLWPVISDMLLLSHGQAAVERGFSVNREVEQDNLGENSNIALRQVYGHVQSVGGVMKVNIDKSLMSSCSQARSRYHQAMDEERNARKRKAETAAKSEHSEKCRRLKSDIDELSKAADDLAFEAESAKGAKSSRELLLKSNAIRRDIKKKQEELSLLQVA